MLAINRGLLKRIKATLAALRSPCRGRSTSLRVLRCVARRGVQTAPLKYSLLAFAFLIFFAPCFSAEQTVSYIPARDYFTTALTEINNAQHSIHIVLYLFSLYPNSPQSKAMRLADALVAAHKRGVNVEIVLDKNAFSKGHGEPEETGDNQLAYGYLSSHGVQACFADVPQIVHAKAIVIDSQTVIVGSANWSESAFDHNVEASVLIREKTVAAQMLAELGRVPTKTPAPNDSVYVNLPSAFLDTGLLGRMVTNQDERAFDTYLFICKLACVETPRCDTLKYPKGCGVSARRGSTVMGEFPLNADSLARFLGISSMTRQDYRRQIIKTLKKLAQQYKLIEFDPAYNADTHISINKFSDTGFVAIPESYFTYGWRARLDFPAKVMYVLGLYYSSVSLSTPQWSMAGETIALRHGLSRWFVTEGVTALRRANLLDVVYDKVPHDNDTTRHANVYTPLPIYDPAALDSAWKRLETRYGREQTDRARKWAAIVYKDCDFRAVEQFIGLENKYGLDKMENAARIIAQKSADNPRRTVGYFVSTVTGMK